MKTGQKITTVLCILLWWVVPCSAQEQARTFIAALEAYKSGDYAAAVDQFTAMAHSGIQNGKLYYNLGNAHLKNNDLGAAILWYERALKLIPNDPDLRFNYQFARSMTKDATEEEAQLVRILFFWKYQLSPSTIALAAIGFNLLFWIALIARRFTRRLSIRRIAVAASIPALIFALTAGYNYYENAHRQQAIVLPSQTAVRSGFQKGSTELFKLHAGAKVTVLKILKDHCQIRFSKDKIGWVPQDQIGLIP